MLRLVGAGTFYARHDRARLHGLFEATLDVNRSMGTDETKAAVLNAASHLLRSPDASLGVSAPSGDELAASMDVGDETLWLRVAGRSQTEPFDDADQTLLEALASVGSIALVNTKLYAEVQQQKDKLSTITSSLGEGVCAISETGEITFLNPAGASMLGWYTVGAGEDDGPRAAGARDAPLPARPGHAGHRAAAQRHQLRHPLRPARRVALPGDHDGLARRRRLGALGGGDRVPRHLGAQGLRGTAGPPRLPGRARPAWPTGASCSTTSTTRSCRRTATAARWACSSATSTASRWSTTTWATRWVTSCCG